jgi:hypothetical protein
LLWACGVWLGSMVEVAVRGARCLSCGVWLVEVAVWGIGARGCAENEGISA